jgi:signal transduction histidine kinase
LPGGGFRHSLPAHPLTHFSPILPSVAEPGEHASDRFDDAAAPPPLPLAGGGRWRAAARLAALWAASAAFWGGVVLLMAARKYVARALTWPPAYFAPAVRGLAPDYVAYAVLSPVVVLLAGRVPVPVGRRRAGIAVHVALALLFSAACAGTIAWLDPSVYPMPGTLAPPGWATRARYAFVSRFSDDLLVYAAVLLATLAVSYYRAHQARELRAAELEARLSRAQLQALRSQIQPHFLFNTLHSISALMGTDPPGARRMIADLKELLSLALEHSEEQEVTLAGELAFVEKYVSIQRTRFRDRVAVEYRVDREVLDARVPRLVLQPLVENSIRHGLAPRTAPGCIEVRAARSGSWLVLAVSDDGEGLPDGGDRPAREGVGLGNTRARLRGLYGDAHSLEARGGRDGGFRVELRIPYSDAAGLGAGAAHG